MAGGSSRQTGDGKKKARIEIIPLIDVIFFLLATFVLFTLSLTKSGGIPVKLPEASTGIGRETAGSVTISVTAEGTVGWNKDQITLDEFITRLRTEKANNPDAKVLVNGDADASFTSVFGYVVDEIRKAGFQKIFIETQSKPVTE